MAAALCSSKTFSLTPEDLATLLASVLSELPTHINATTHSLSAQFIAELLETTPDTTLTLNTSPPNTQIPHPLPKKAISAPPHLLSGYPQRPLVSEVARALCVWAQTEAYPIYLPALHLLQEAAQIDSGVVETVRCIFLNLRACEDEEAARQLTRSILQALGEWGLLSLLRLRHTVGSLPLCPPPLSALTDSFNQRHRPNTAALLTVGARALAKHCQRDCTSAWWGVSTGGEQQKNAHAETVLRRILEDAVWINIHALPHQVHVLEIRTSLGYGARWSADGMAFRGFLEPQQEDGHAAPSTDMAPNTTPATGTPPGGSTSVRASHTTAPDMSALTGHKRAGGVGEMVRDIKGIQGLHELAEHIGDGSLAMELGSVEEQALLAELQERGGDAWYMKEAGEMWQLACLRARKYNVERALLLVEAYMGWRRTFQVDTITPATNESLLSQLRAGIIRAPGMRDKLGRTALVLDLSKHDPHKWNALETVRHFHCVVERMLLDNPEAQARGVVIVVIGTNIRLGNLDTRVPQELFKAFSRQLPIRLGGQFVVDPPRFLRIVFPVIRRFMPAKFQERMFLLGDGARGLLEHFDRDEILVELGGTKKYDHTAYVDRLVQLARDGQKSNE